MYVTYFSNVNFKTSGYMPKQQITCEWRENASILCFLKYLDHYICVYLLVVQFLQDFYIKLINYCAPVQCTLIINKSKKEKNLFPSINHDIICNQHYNIARSLRHNLIEIYSTEQAPRLTAELTKMYYLINKHCVVFILLLDYKPNQAK